MAAKIGGSGGDKHTIEQTADINITPFIDILLVLMATVSIRLDLPPAQPPTNPTEEKEPVYITIQENGQLFISDKQTSIDNLAADVCTALGGGACQEERVFVRAQPEVKYSQFMEVMNKMQENGFFKVGLLNEDIE